MLRSSRAGRFALLIALVAPVGFVSCDDSDDDVAGPSTGLVTTFTDPSVDFGAETTFAFIDTVVHLAPFGSGRRLAVPRRFDRALLDRVRQNLLSRDFVEVRPPFNRAPDFIVLVGAAAQANYDAFVTYAWYTWWGFYPGWTYYAPGFDETWGVLYPWGATVHTEIERASLIVEVLDATVLPGTQHLTVMWTAVARAGLDGTVTGERLLEAVDEMFDRSPYLARESRRR